MFLAYSPKRWGSFGETPIWLTVQEIIDDKWKVTQRVKEGREHLPGKYIRPPQSDSINIVGLELPLMVEKDFVIASLIGQVKEICESCTAE